MDRKGQIMRLWRCCFDDGEDFVGRFFSRVYREENARTLEEDGQVVCAMHVLPYVMNYHGEAVPAAYFYGICTHPAYRRRGYMRLLLEQSLLRLEEEGCGLAFLIPADEYLFDCYRKSGFTEAFGCCRAVLSFPEVPEGPVGGIGEMAASDAYDCWSYLDRKWREEPVSILHGWEDFLFNCQDVVAGGGKCFLYREGGAVRGVLMAVPSDGRLFLPEWKADAEPVRHALFRAAAAAFHRKEIGYLLPGKTSRYGMARVLRPDRLLPRWREKHPGMLPTAEAWRALSAGERTKLLLDGPESSGYMRLMMD